jgi:hypothetical protein
MTVLTPYAVAVAAKKAGWPQDKIAWVVMTTFGESSWRTDAIGGPNSRGEYWYGLGQISDVHKDSMPNFFPPSDNWKDPVKNLAAMLIVYDAQGSGAYLGAPESNSRAASVSGQASMAAAQVAANPPPSVQGQSTTDAAIGTLKYGVGVAAALLGANPGGTVLGNPNLSIDANGNVTGTTGGVLGAVAGEGDGLSKIAWIAGGALMVILGLLLLFKSQMPVGKIASVLK